MPRRRRRGTTRYIGDLIDDSLDRASDVEHGLRRTARTAVEERPHRDRDRDHDHDWDDDDWWDDDWDWDWGDCDDDEVEEILDDLADLLRKVHHCHPYRGRRGRGRRRPPNRRAGASGQDLRELAGHIVDLNRRVERLSRRVRSERGDDEPD
jgi:hypothetical protein